MSYVITDSCNNCGTCVETCPSEAIKAAEPHHVIDSEECIDCGACAGECPNNAIQEV